MKKSIICLVMMINLTIGNVTAFADAVPGVTEPYDPSDYYDPLTVSVPDSVPSPFTVTDLAGNGYQVYDAPREKQSIIASIKSITEMVNQMTRLANQIKDLASMSPEGLLAHYTGVSNVLGDVVGTWQAYNGLLSATSTANNAWSSAFTQVHSFITGQTSATAHIKNQQDLLQALENTYRDSMSAAQMASNQEAEVALLKNSLTNLQNADGGVETEQIAAQIESINTTLLIKRNFLISNLITVRTTRNQDKLTQKKNSMNEVTNGLTFGTPDPYHPDAYQQQVFTRPQGQGMINF